MLICPKCQHIVVHMPICRGCIYGSISGISDISPFSGRDRLEAEQGETDRDDRDDNPPQIQTSQDTSGMYAERP